jgi:glutathione S-transferase
MSPYAAKVHCFLLRKKLDFECFYISPFRVKQDLPIGKQIPVLCVGQEQRADSTPIGLWLDELFPDTPRLLPENPAQRDPLLRIDDWVSQRLIPGSFLSYPGEGINRALNGWKLSSVMGNTARGGIPLPIRLVWPLLITRVGFVRRLIEQADDGLPVRESKLKLYDEFVAHLGGGAFLGDRTAPSLPDFSAHPQFALYYQVGFHGADDIEGSPEIMSWLERMKPYLSGTPPMLPDHVCKRQMPRT